VRRVTRASSAVARTVESRRGVASGHAVSAGAGADALAAVRADRSETVVHSSLRLNARTCSIGSQSTGFRMPLLLQGIPCANQSALQDVYTSSRRSRSPPAASGLLPGKGRSPLKRSARRAAFNLATIRAQTRRLGNVRLLSPDPSRLRVPVV
jgi:hypothetical protein